ncbi:MAG: aspartate/glutamate racemase family protein [Hyphomonadaceae bacterium]|jgi:glutamate racemase|nr:aspartate/glutamate racemase family protein [Hyphomonadaceae bacterium]
MGDARTRVAVFDSGAGGLSVVRALRAAGLPLDISYAADTEWFPYGDRNDADLLARLPGLMGEVVRVTQADLLITACNTASTLALDTIRASVSVPVVGVVPAVKPAAALTRTGVIGLLATPRTIARTYTDRLISTHAAGVRVLRHGPPDLALAAEQVLARQTVDPSVFERAMEGLLVQEALAGAPMDVVVLACTHYPFVQNELAATRALGGRSVLFLEPGDAIARRTGDLLGLAPGSGTATLSTAFTTGGETLRLLGLVRTFGFAAIASLADCVQRR